MGFAVALGAGALVLLLALCGHRRLRAHGAAVGAAA
jgi:hypothetical protein